MIYALYQHGQNTSATERFLGTQPFITFYASFKDLYFFSGSKVGQDNSVL